MFKIQFSDQYYPELLEFINPNNYSGGSLFSRVSFQFDIGYGLGTSEIIITLNGKRLYGGHRKGTWTPQIRGWYFFQQFNNGVYKLIAGNETKVIIETAQDILGPNEKFELRLKNKLVYIIIDDPNAHRKGHDILSNIKDERVHLYQFIEETITGIKEYQNSILKATDKISPQDVEKVKSEHFSYDMSQKYTYRVWLPLETAWQEYKENHNIREEDVQRVIKEEEEKEKEHERAFKKQSKKWWQR